MAQKVIFKRNGLQTYIFMAALLLLSSCKKNASDITSDSAKKTEAKQIILSSIASKKKIATEQGKEKLNNLIKGLDFEALKIEKETDTSSIIVVPAKIRFETLAKINNSLSYYLIIKVVKGYVGSENIVAFKPENAEPKNLASNNLKIALNRKSNAENGVYIFMNYTGSYLYSLTYENSQLHTVAFPLKKSDNIAALRTENGTVCVDWYHVTYYYDENGYFLYKNEEYLYQTCYSCGEITPWGQALECDYLNDDTGGGSGVAPSLPETQKTWTVATATSNIWMVSATERFYGINDPNKGGKQFTSVEHLGDNAYALVEGVSVTWDRQGVTTSHTAWTATSQITGKLSVVLTGSVNAAPEDVFVDMQIDKKKNWLITDIWQ